MRELGRRGGCGHPREGVTGSRVSWGPGVPQEGLCRRSSTVTGVVRAPRRVSWGMRNRGVHVCPGKGVTEDGVAWGPCMTQEGHCRIQGIAWPVDALGRASQGVGHHVCSGKGVVEDGAFQGPAIPPGRESCGTRHCRILLPPG